MTPNQFDQACRYLLRLHAAPLLSWLLGLPPERLDFVEWLDARQVPWPGQPDRVCDTVAHLRDPLRGGLPWAMVVEFQIEPDEQMFGRVLSYLGELWRACKPTPHRGDRFQVGAVVVNLTDRGRASSRMRLSGTRLGTALSVVEWNLASKPARRLLAQVEAGEAPRAALAWLPLFKGGDRPGIIDDWRRLAEQETDVEVRRALGLAVLFAEPAGCAPLWREALKEWNIVESKIVQEWTKEARQQGKIEGQAGALLDVLDSRFGATPPELAGAIRACTDLEQLRRWTRQAAKVSSLAKFRRDAGL
jgi:hypothetical protein